MSKITKIEVQKRNKERVNLFIDGEFTFSVSAELVYKEKLKTNEEIDYEKIKDLAEKEGYSRCKESSLRIIEKSYKTEKEMRDKLRLKGYEEKYINYSLDFLMEYNFIDDRKYTKAFVNDKLSSMGSQKIRYKLLQKGISREIIDSELEDVSKESERNLALDMAKKKLAIIKKRENNNYKISGKLYNYLISKGYRIDITSDIVKEVMCLDEF